MSMNICLIGASGHWSDILNGTSGKVMNIAGIAPGSQGEDVGTAFKMISDSGYQPRLYNDYRKMLEELRPDVAVVDCFFGDHARVAVDCFDHGCHVFMEKPVATTLEDLDKLRKSCTGSGKQMAGMFSMRYISPFLTIWKAVKEGIAGEIRLMHAQKSYKLGTRGEHYKIRELYGGTIPWVGSHAIDWIYWLNGGRFLSVYASHSTLNNNDHGELEVSAACLFRMTNEVIATVNIDYLRPEQASTHGDDRIRVVGTKGVLEVREGKVFFTGSGVEGTRQLEPEPERKIFPEFIDQLRGKGTCLVTAEDSFVVTEACIKARISADENRMIIF